MLRKQWTGYVQITWPNHQVLVFVFSVDPIFSVIIILFGIIVYCYPNFHFMQEGTGF